MGLLLYLITKSVKKGIDLHLIYIDFIKLSRLRLSLCGKYYGNNDLPSFINHFSINYYHGYLLMVMKGSIKSYNNEKQINEILYKKRRL